MKIRDAAAADLPGVLDIYNEVIAHSTAIYTEQASTLADRQAWCAARTGQGYPVLVAVDATGVVGFASFGDFRAWPGYRFTVEHSVHVRVDRRGTGIGSALMTPLLARASAIGKRVMVAAVDAENAASLRFHERLGFEPVAHFKQIGFKFNRWLDLIFLQKTLDAA